MDTDDDEDDNSRAENDDSSGMVIDAPHFSNRNHKEVMVDEPRPSETAEAEDGWTIVAPRRNKATRN